MIQPDSGDRVRRRRGGEPAAEASAGRHRASFTSPEPPASRESNAAPIGDDLWSAPKSAATIGDDLEGLLGSWRSPVADDVPPDSPTNAVPATEVRPRPGRGADPLPADDSPRHRPYGLALAVAVVILVSLGFVARRLDAPTESDTGRTGGQPAAINSVDSSPPVLPAATPPVSAGPSPTGSSTGELVLEGSADCPMRLGSLGRGTQPPSSDELRCFFIG